MYKKGLVIGIIVLLIATNVLPATGTVMSKNTKLEGQQIVVEKISTTHKNDNVNCHLQNQYYLQNFRHSKNEKKSLESNFHPKQLIIKFKEDTEITIGLSSDNIVLTGITSIDNINKKNKVISAEKLFEGFSIPGLSSIYKFIFSDDVNIYYMMKEYGLDSSIEYAEPNYIYHLSSNSYSIENEQNGLASTSSNSMGSGVLPDDPYFDQQWALNQSNDCDIDAPEAWQIEKGSPDVIIAIIDTGVDYNHPDLADNIWINIDEIPENGIDDDNNGFIDDIHGWDFIKNDNDPNDDNGHGTFCSGIASAVTNNSIGIAGLSWNSKIMPIDVIKDDVVYQDAATKGLYYAVENDADIISMSWGGYYPNNLYEDALSYAYAQGVVLIASAGNENTDRNVYPASYENVIAVAATDQNDNRAKEEYGWASNYGYWVDVAAPGMNILSTDKGNNYAKASGTSLACPFVSGLSALLLSKHEQCPYPAQMVRSVIRYTTDEIETDEYIGTGRINVYKALMMEPFAFNLEAIPNWKDTKGSIDIEGTIWGEDLQYFVLDIGIGENPSSWMILVNSTTPQGGIIFTLDSTLLDEGLYSLRLQAVYTHGTLVENNLIYVNNEADGVYDADIYVSNCFDSSTPGWEVTRFDSIQNGIDKAKKGDRIFVYDGIYPEDIKITGKLLNLKTIELIGQNKEWTIIKGCVNISYGKKVQVIGFTVRDGIGVWGDIYYYEVLFYFSYNCKISDCYIVNSYDFDTIRIDFSSKTVIRGNNITGIYDPEGWSSPAIMNSVSFKSKISDNTIFQNGLGIGMLFVRSSVVSNNTFIDCGECFLCLVACNNLIYKNKIIKYDIGVDLWMGCFRNVIAANSFINGSEVFLGWEGQFGNHFYLNNVMGGYVYDEGYNLWYKPGGLLKGKGNYWFDYSGKDRNGDGIGDSPYNIRPRIAFNRDRFPYMEPIDMESIEEIEGFDDLIDGNYYKMEFLSELLQKFFFNRFCSTIDIGYSLSYKDFNIFMVYRSMLEEVMTNEI